MDYRYGLQERGLKEEVPRKLEFLAFLSLSLSLLNVVYTLNN
jgi:hypothetical protein